MCLILFCCYTNKIQNVLCVHRYIYILGSAVNVQFFYNKLVDSCLQNQLIVNNCLISNAYSINQHQVKYKSYIIYLQGHFNANTGQYKCTKCAAGSSQINVEQSTCIECPVGHVSETGGQSVCTPCSIFKISNIISVIYNFCECQRMSWCHATISQLQ